ncbi:GDP-L-fucose synthase [Deltaproteobacteria bacterium]|nr:GDP-L-fucose synthase [Deltaproteobacteria bacterium]
MPFVWNEPLSLVEKRVLVTGGHGFLGKHLTRVLHARGAEALPVGRGDSELIDDQDVREMFWRLKPDFVIHAAAVGGGIGWMKEHPATSFSGNVLANTHVLDVACELGVRRLVGVSSACAYPRDAEQPMREAQLFGGEPEPTNGPYGWSKRAMMVHGRALVAEHGFDCAFAVPTNLYGPGESFDPERSHVVGALVRRFVEAADRGDPEVVCWGTGRATRDLLHVADAAEGIVRLLEVGGGPAPVNLGSGVERSIEAIALAVASAVGYAGGVRWDTDKPDGMPRKVLDISAMRARTGWAPACDFSLGLQETVACFRSSR